MFKAFAFLTKREGLEMQEFIDYYEGKHIPLILSLAPAPLIYKRRYIVRDQELTKSGNLVDYDVMTELGFADQEEFASWMGKLSAPGIAEQVAEDEGRFLDRSRIKVYVVQEHETPVSEERALVPRVGLGGTTENPPRGAVSLDSHQPRFQA